MKICHMFAIASVFAIAGFLTGGGVTANAQYTYDNYYPPTPSQGPPLASGTTFFTVDTFITPEVYGRIDRSIRDNNHCYNAVKSGAPSCFSTEGVDDNDNCVWGCTKNGVFIPRPTSAAMISASEKRYSPRLSQTLYPDRPNENVAQTPFFVVYSLTQIWGCGSLGCHEYPYSRTVSQSIDVYIACQDWQKGAGKLAAATVVSRAYMDADHSVVEDTLFGILWNDVIPNYVDSRVRSALSNFGSGTSSKLLGKTDPDGTFHPIDCSRLGVLSFPNEVDAKFETINYDYFPTRILLAAQQITVRITQIRRLALHDSSGSIVRYATEYPMLEFYAGYAKTTLNLPPMMENSTYYPPSTAALSVPVPSDAGQLILIANMWDLSHYTRDPRFAVFDRTSNWGSGTQKILTPKIWSELSPLYRKPILMRGNGYEVTLQITGPPTAFRAF